MAMDHRLAAARHWAAAAPISKCQSCVSETGCQRHCRRSRNDGRCGGAAGLEDGDILGAKIPDHDDDECDEKPKPAGPKGPNSNTATPKVNGIASIKSPSSNRKNVTRKRCKK